MDGAGWHKTKALKAPADMALIFPPPCSRRLNPVEHIWESIRENDFRNEVFKSIEGVENQLSRSLTALESNPASVASITAFPWIVSITLNAT
jgi:transposase